MCFYENQDGRTVHFIYLFTYLLIVSSKHRTMLFMVMSSDDIGAVLKTGLRGSVAYASHSEEKLNVI